MTISTTNLKIPEIFQPVMESCPYVHPYISLPGGRGSAKSHSVGVYAILKALASPTKILFAREFQNSIKDSSYQVLINTIEKMNVSHMFTILKTEITCHNGSSIVFKGLKTNIGSIKSFEDVGLCVVEEAETVSDDSWEALIPTIRAEGSQIVVIFNPKLKASPT
jgi:phage terminase large subunit